MSRPERLLIIIFSFILIVMLILIMSSIIRYLQEKARYEEIVAARQRDREVDNILENAYRHLNGAVYEFSPDANPSQINLAICLAGAHSISVSWDLLGSSRSACNMLVSFDPENGIYRDIRGLVNLLTGYRQQALKDFHFYSQWLSENGLYSQFGFERQQWINLIEGLNHTYGELVYQTRRVAYVLGMFNNPLIKITF